MFDKAKQNIKEAQEKARTNPGIVSKAVSPAYYQGERTIERIEETNKLLTRIIELLELRP